MSTVAAAEPISDEDTKLSSVSVSVSASNGIWFEDCMGIHQDSQQSIQQVMKLTTVTEI